MNHKMKLQRITVHPDWDWFSCRMIMASSLELEEDARGFQALRLPGFEAFRLSDFRL